MEDPEDEQKEGQEETTAVHEAEPEPASEGQNQPQPEEEPKSQDVSPSIEPAVKQKPPEDGAVHEERRSSMKRTSIDGRAKSTSITQDTFVPPKQATDYNSEKGGSVPQSGRRSSGLIKIPSIHRKSRFGGLSSKARMVLGSIVDIKSNAGEYYDKRVAKYQNTYRMDSDNPFNSEKVDKILKEVMQEVLENLQYDTDKCASTAKYASTQIRMKVKQLEFDRYKLVCIVSIGEKNSQDVYATCRFLWDSEKDRYAFYSLENTHVYAIAYCFGLYYE